MVRWVYNYRCVHICMHVCMHVRIDVAEARKNHGRYALKIGVGCVCVYVCVCVSCHRHRTGEERTVCDARQCIWHRTSPINYTHTYICVCVCMYIYIYIYIYTCLILRNVSGAARTLFPGKCMCLQMYACMHPS
jgi:hypothetical protein